MGFLLWLEVVLCFSIPAYFLFWGVFSLMIMMPMALTGEMFAIVNCLIVFGGSLGLITLIDVCRILLFEQATPYSLPTTTIPFAIAGVVAIWAGFTGQFAELEFDVGTLTLVGTPTLATVHLVWLAHRRQSVSNDA